MLPHLQPMQLQHSRVRFIYAYLCWCYSTITSRTSMQTQIGRGRTYPLRSLLRSLMPMRFRHSKRPRDVLLLRVFTEKGWGPRSIWYHCQCSRGTTIAAWADTAVLAACPDSTYSSSVASPLVLYNGMTAPLINTTISAMVWYQGKSNESFAQYGLPNMCFCR